MKKLLLAILLMTTAVPAVFGQATTTIRASLIPDSTDTYDLGSLTKLYRKGYLSELDAVLLAKNTASVVGGWLIVPKQTGVLPYGLQSTDTVLTVDAALDSLDIIEIRALFQVEYMQINSSWTKYQDTLYQYKVIRDLSNAGPLPGIPNIWPKGAVWFDMGHSGEGRVELEANDGIPRVSVFEQGSNYNAQTEVFRAGDLAGMPNSASGYGVYVGNDTNYMQYSNGLLKMRGSMTISTKIPTSWVDSLGTLAKLNAVSWNDSTLSGVPLDLKNFVAPPSGAGLYLDGTHLGYYSGSAWTTYMNNYGQFYLSGTGSNYLYWNDTTLTIAGNITITGGNAATTTYTNDAVAAALGSANFYSDSTDSVIKSTTESYADGLIPATIKPPSGSGLFLSSGHMGYYSSGTWMSYFDSLGDEQLGNPSTGNGLSWNQTAGTLTINGTINVVGGNAATTTYANGVASTAQSNAESYATSQGYQTASNVTTIIGNTVTTGYVNALNVTAASLNTGNGAVSISATGVTDINLGNSGSFTITNSPASVVLGVSATNSLTTNGNVVMTAISGLNASNLNSGTVPMSVLPISSWGSESTSIGLIGGTNAYTRTLTINGVSVTVVTTN